MSDGAKPVSYDDLLKRHGYAPGSPIPSGVIVSGRLVPGSAAEFLQRAKNIMEQRGRDYDAPDGERGMSKMVAAFNAITGSKMTTAEGWLFMLILKQVRQWQARDFHQDSADDGIAYAALLAEALATNEVKHID
jgi:hypothetical protein